jgi:hypothetical protein
MTDADEFCASGADQGTRLPQREQYLEEYLRLGPPLTNAQLDELRELRHRLLSPD